MKRAHGSTMSSNDLRAARPMNVSSFISSSVSQPLRVVRTSAGLLVLMLGLIGCQAAAPRLANPTRAIWVTRFDYRTADDVAQIMEHCQSAGLNTVMFQVRGNGTAFYRSRREPWAQELGGKDPGFDPLEVACREAHARHIQLHAWVNVMPA